MNRPTNTIFLNYKGNTVSNSISRNIPIDSPQRVVSSSSGNRKENRPQTGNNIHTQQSSDSSSLSKNRAIFAQINVRNQASIEKYVSVHRKINQERRVLPEYQKIQKRKQVLRKIQPQKEELADVYPFEAPHSNKP